MKPSFKERKQGEDILRAYKKLRRFRFRNIKRFRLSRLNFENPKFQDHIKIINGFIDIVDKAKKGKDIKFVEACSQYNERISQNNVTQEIQSELQDVCIEIFLNQIISADLNSNIVRNYFVNNISQFTKKNNIRNFRKWLKDIKEDDNSRVFLKEAITKNIEDIDLHKELLTDFSFSKELTIETQKKILNKRKHQVLFRKEINNYERSFYTLLKENKAEEAKNLLLKLADFAVANKDYFSNSFLSDNFISMVRRLSVEGVHKEGKEVLKRIRQIAGPEDANDLLFFILFTHLVREDYRGAYDEIKKMGILKNIENQPGQIQFWTAYTMKQLGMNASSEKLYKITLRNSPLDYYSILARKELGSQLDTSYFESDKKEYLENFGKIRGDLLSSVERMIIWLKLGHERFAEHEMNDIIDYHIYNIKNFDPDAKLDLERRSRSVIFRLASILDEDERYLLNFKLIIKSISKNMIPLNEDNLKYLFPMDYLEKITSIDNNIDPILVISLIRQESAFNPNARSHAGARGLMQLMPSTARMYASIKSTRSLRKPELNLRIGMKYLTILLKKYSGDLLHTLAAYNAGERRVSRWAQEIFISDNPLLNVESIPFRETRYYVKLIFRNIFFYEYLTKKTSNLVSIEKSFKVSFNDKKEPSKKEDQTLNRK